MGLMAREGLYFTLRKYAYSPSMERTAQLRSVTCHMDQTSDAGERAPEERKAELILVVGYVPRWFTCPQTVTHPGSGRTQRRPTSLIKTMC